MNKLTKFAPKGHAGAIRIKAGGGLGYTVATFGDSPAGSYAYRLWLDAYGAIPGNVLIDGDTGETLVGDLHAMLEEDGRTLGQ